MIPFSFSLLRVQRRSNSESGDAKFTSSSSECCACTGEGVPVFHSTSSCDRQPGRAGRVIDPRSRRVKSWNRLLLVSRGMALAVDPLFFYALSIRRQATPCLSLYMDHRLAATVSVIRTCLDALHLCHVCLQLRMAYVSRESLVLGCGNLVWDARAILHHYLSSLTLFWFDAFVILPIPQVELSPCSNVAIN